MFTLLPHPACRPKAVDRLDVDLYRGDDDLRLEFAIHGDMARINLPAESRQLRRDGLWRSTCFEVFIMPADGERYFEINLSPSTEWAAYRFDRYRQGMRPALISPDQHLHLMNDGEIFAMSGNFDLGERELATGTRWRVGLSAVVEANDGTKSYWALAHPPGPPDFHHEACFALALADIARR